MKQGDRDLIRYGHLIALLHLLVKEGMLTEEEAQGIKERIMEKYNVLSDYSA